MGRPPAALVGRDDSLGVLKAAMRRASAGHPSVLIVTGETGVGKTRLVRELIDTERVTLLAGSCVPMAGDPLPFAPLTQALRRLDRTGTLNLQLERLPELARLVPGVAPAMTRTADLAAASQLGLFQSVLDLVDRLGEAEQVIELAGVRPVKRRKMLVRCSWWANPQANATSAMDIGLCRSRLARGKSPAA